ncbi:unnamed protein product [Amoebophrya sp. A120]|nr:unnamed protein product [Amoebophrya sp. A120]|eukprot:GSA120T00010411001.1
MPAHSVLLATEKPFAGPAVAQIDDVLKHAGYTLEKLENYKDVGELKTALAKSEAAIVRSDKMTAEIMDACKDSLKLIVRAGAGVDTIDLNAATERGMVVMNTPGQNSNAVAELAFGMMITQIRNHYDGSSGYELKGKTLALHGFGQVARNMFRLAKGFEMKVLAYDPFLKKEDIESAGAVPVGSVAELFDANFVSLHIPCTPETKESIGKDFLLKMPKNGVLVNTARAEVVHEAGLLEAFAERADLSYISDVAPTFDMEQLNASKKRCFVTKKKMGAQTSEANNNAGIAAAKQIVDFFEKGDVRFQVNKPGQTF